MAVYSYSDSAGRKRWRADLVVGYDLEGKPDRRSPSFATKRQAQNAEVDLRILKDGLQGHSDSLTFQGFIDNYYLPMKRESLRKNTVRMYESVINNHLKPTFSNTRLRDINRMQIQKLLSSRSSYKVAKNTRDVLRQILGEALQMEAIQYNPASGRFKLPEKTEAPTKGGQVVSSVSEHQRFIDLAEGNVKAILILGLCFGLRKGEILGLDWQDIDFKSKTITIKRTYTYTKGTPDITPPKTEESKRTIPMSMYAYGQLRGLLGGVDHIGAVVAHNKSRMSPTVAYKAVVKFAHDNKLPGITIMSLRHSYATAAVTSGMDVAKLSKILGHTNITTTLNRYVRPLQNDLQGAVDMMDLAYSRAAK